MNGNSCPRTLAILGAAACAPVASLGAPLFTVAACQSCKLTAALLALNLGRDAWIPAMYLSAALAAAWPGAVVTAWTPAVYAWPAAPRFCAHFAAASAGFGIALAMTHPSVFEPGRAGWRFARNRSYAGPHLLAISRAACAARSIPQSTQTRGSSDCLMRVMRSLQSTQLKVTSCGLRLRPRGGSPPPL